MDRATGITTRIRYKKFLVEWKISLVASTTHGEIYIEFVPSGTKASRYDYLCRVLQPCTHWVKNVILICLAYSALTVEATVAAAPPLVTSPVKIAMSECKNWAASDDALTFLELRSIISCSNSSSTSGNGLP
jgi:hypothetical protein